MEKIGKAPRSYTTGQAARLCGISQQSIIRCFDGGTLKGFRVPGSKFRKIPRQSLLSFMLEQGIPTDALAPFSAEEREEIARVAGGPAAGPAVKLAAL